MHRLVLSVVALGSLVASAQAKPAKPPLPAPPTLPAAGDGLSLTGPASWPKLDWLYDVPAASDAAGKVVIHWFCAPKIPACADDLARVIALRDTGEARILSK